MYPKNGLNQAIYVSRQLILPGDANRKVQSEIQPFFRLLEELEANHIRLVLIRLATEDKQVSSAHIKPKCGLECRINFRSQVSRHAQQLRLAHHVQVVSELGRNVDRKRSVNLAD